MWPWYINYLKGFCKTLKTFRCRRVCLQLTWNICIYYPYVVIVKSASCSYSVKINVFSVHLIIAFSKNKCNVSVDDL